MRTEFISSLITICIAVFGIATDAKWETSSINVINEQEPNKRLISFLSTHISQRSQAPITYNFSKNVQTHTGTISFAYKAENGKSGRFILYNDEVANILSSQNPGGYLDYLLDTPGYLTIYNNGNLDWNLIASRIADINTAVIGVGVEFLLSYSPFQLSINANNCQLIYTEEELNQMLKLSRLDFGKYVYDKVHKNNHL